MATEAASRTYGPLYPLFDKIQATTAGFSQAQIDALHAHNEYRYRHGAEPMTLNKTICDHATVWAQVSGGATKQNDIAI